MNKNNEEFKINQFATYGLFGGGALFLIGLLYIIKYQSNKGLRPGEMLNFDQLGPQTKKMLEKWKCRDHQDISCPEWKKYCESKEIDICKIGTMADDNYEICMYKDSKCVPRKLNQISNQGSMDLKKADKSNTILQRELPMEIVSKTKKNNKLGGNRLKNSKKNKKHKKSKKKCKL